MSRATVPPPPRSVEWRKARRRAMLHARMTARLDARSGVPADDGAARFAADSGLFYTYHAAYACASRWSLHTFIERNTPEPAPRWSREFPAFPAADMPSVPSGWQDESWHNDACPRFTYQPKEEGALLWLWIDRADPTQRQYGADVARFILSRHNADDAHIVDVYEGDDWQACLARMTTEAIALEYATRVRAELTSAELTHICAENAKHPEYDSTHSFIDANMPMHEAFVAVVGRDPIATMPMSDADIDQWNAAGRVAQLAYFTKGN